MFEAKVGHGRVQVFGNPESASCLSRWQQNRKLLPAVAGNKIISARQVVAQGMSNLHQVQIAGDVAFRVVQCFEEIDVDHQQGERLAGTLRRAELEVESLVKCAAIGNARKAVAACQLLQSLLCREQRFLGPNAPLKRDQAHHYEKDHGEKNGVSANPEIGS